MLGAPLDIKDLVSVTYESSQADCTPPQHVHASNLKLATIRAECEVSGGGGGGEGQGREGWGRGNQRLNARKTKDVQKSGRRGTKVLNGAFDQVFPIIGSLKRR